MLRSCLARFVAKEDGAVAVDWVAMTGAAVGLAILILIRVVQGTTEAASGIGTQLDNVEIPGTTFTLGPPNQASGPGGASDGSMAP